MKLFNDRFSKSGSQSSLSQSLRRVAVAAALMGGVAVASMAPGITPLAAQDSLNAQVERLQRELTALQRQVYRGEAPPAGAAAAATGGDLSGTQAARIELRLSQFESELRSLTGQVEQFGFKINQVGKRLDSLVADVDLRLQNLEQRVDGGAAVSDNSGAVGAGTGAASAGGAPASQTGGAPGTLGVINQGDLQQFQNNQGSGGTAQAGAAGGAAQTAAAGALPGGTPQEQYSYAFSLLRQAQYNEAEQALRVFVEQNPEDPLAGNAKYWLGETYYVRGDYQQSAVIFAEAYQQYPNNTKAPDNLLKLGMSLGALGNTADACGTFAELLKRYPQAPATVQRRTQQEQERYSCS
ncbi:tol-pal system protein YbgF [Denitrobaculum tricleocarpae]|nr:tol-pal system protein YbgF [Denitrobaculum tricleocarpae]